MSTDASHPTVPLDPVHVGWGRKRSGLQAVNEAGRKRMVFQLREDGFLRSVGRGDDALSIVSDDEGIYYDASVASRLEKLIARKRNANEFERARRIIRQWRALRLSKYNEAREYSDALPSHYVLVIDQTSGDLSIEYGQADEVSFDRMLKAALDENPDSTIIVKMHPDVYTRKKAGNFDVHALEQMERVLVVAENCHPVRLIEHANKVYTVTSQVGFEALIWGKPVRCFGMPFYAGWGLTADALPAPERRQNLIKHKAHKKSQNESDATLGGGVPRDDGSSKISLEQLVHASLVDYPRYIDPEHKERCEVEAVMEHIGLQHRMRSCFPAKLYAIGFSRWKKPLVQLFFQGSDTAFVKRANEVPSGATLLIWGSAEICGLPPECNILRIEDGFLRSSGLGADLIRPMSWVVDDCGIYYDATRPSRLERILQDSTFEEALLERAQSFRACIVKQGIGKYNMGASGWLRPPHAKHVILVPGQVENDASIRFGAPKGATNLGLLKAVREANPHSYIVYKPHPDVVAGLRRSGRGEDEVQNWCNEIVSTGDAVQMLDEVDEVHTQTSLTGFEALLRGVEVICHGNPFYAGWGLTTDLNPLARRTRKLTLDELVAGALILYPTYVSRVTDAYTTPERAVEELVEWRDAGPSMMPIWRRGLRGVLRWWTASGLRRNA